MNMATRDTSNKDTGKFNTKDVGRLDITATSDALVVYTDLAAMVTAYLDRLPVTLHFAEDDAGSPDTTKFYATGKFVITSMDINAADQANASYSCTFDHYSGFTWSGDAALAVGVLGTNCTANEEDDGFVACFPKGGTPPYGFSWDTVVPTTTQYMTDLAPGTYTITVTDEAAAVASASITITEPDA
jgi:hypothetical protein